jgi:hypothetical protein
MGSHRRSVLRSRTTRVAVASVVFTCLTAAAPTQAAKPRAAATLFVMAAQNSGGLGVSGPVLRYDVRGPTGAPTLTRTIDDPSFFRPCCFAFTSSGEMLVVNRGDPFSPQSGYISRIRDPLGDPSPNGQIAFRDFSVPHWAAFRHNQLFVAQLGQSNVLRLRFNGRGVASPAGVIADGLCCTAPRAVAFSSSGELFVTQCCTVSTVNRFTFDGAGNAVPNGVISGNGLNNPQDLAFNRAGELFVANARGNSISRFKFDAAGNATANGQITGAALSGPSGLAFSPWSELFVGNTFLPGGISRWTFSSSGAATFNGSFTTPSNVVIDIQFAPRAACDRVAAGGRNECG